MFVEKHCCGDALDMTWVRFNAILKSLPAFRRIQKEKPMTHAENIEVQKEAKEAGF